MWVANWLERRDVELLEREAHDFAGAPQGVAAFGAGYLRDQRDRQIKRERGGRFGGRHEGHRVANFGPGRNVEGHQ